MKKFKIKFLIPIIAIAITLTNFNIANVVYAKSPSDVQVESLSPKIADTDTMESYSKNNFKVEVKVNNTEEKTVKMCVVFTSYDASGKALQTNSSYTSVPADDYADISTSLDNLDRVTKVQVAIADSTTNKVDLISQGSYIDGNEIKATTVVMNGTADKKPVNLVFTSYDVNGKVLETRSAHSSCVSKNSSWDAIAILKNSGKIAKVDAKIIDSNSGKIEIVNQGSYVDGKNINISATVMNGTADKKPVNLVFTSYDANGRALETRSIHSSYVSGNSAWDASDSFNNLDKVAKVEAKVVESNSGKIELVSQGNYIDRKNIIITATIINGTSDKKPVNVVFASYDAKGKVLETRSTHSSYVSGNSNCDTSASLNNLSNVARVEAKISEVSLGKMEIVNQGNYVDGKNLKVTATVINGSTVKKPANVVFTSYDVNGKALETQSSYTSSVSAGYSWDASVSLINPDKVTKVETKIIEPNQNKIEIVSQGYYIEKNKILLTAVAANGYNDSKNVKFSAISYDARGKMLETPKTNSTISGNSIKDCELSLNTVCKNKQVTSIKIYLNNVQINTIKIGK